MTQTHAVDIQTAQHSIELCWRYSASLPWCKHLEQLSIWIHCEKQRTTINLINTKRFWITHFDPLTSLAKPSGMVNVLVIQQNVLTTCVGSPLTMQCIGWPTYCVAVIIIEQTRSKTVVKVQCNLKTALSVLNSWYLKYTLRPPSSLNILSFELQVLKTLKECAFKVYAKSLIKNQSYVNWDCRDYCLGLRVYWDYCPASETKQIIRSVMCGTWHRWMHCPSNERRRLVISLNENKTYFYFLYSSHDGSYSCSWQRGNMQLVITETNGKCIGHCLWIRHTFRWQRWRNCYQEVNR